MNKKDFTPWLLLPGIVLTLSSVTLLAPHQTAQAAAPPAPLNAQAAPKTIAYDDGDGGNELLEHWGDPQYGREERVQMTGMACGFLLLGVFAFRRRTRNQSRCEIVPLPGESDFLKLDSHQSDSHWDSRKAA